MNSARLWQVVCCSLLSVLVFFSATAATAQTASQSAKARSWRGPEGPTETNMRVARDILRRSLEAYGSMAGRLSVAELRLAYVGSHQYEGSYRDPEERRIFELLGDYRASNFWDAISHTISLKSQEGKSSHGQLLVVGQEVFETEIGSPFGQELSGERERVARVAAWSFLPHQILERVDRDAASLRHLGRVEHAGRPHAHLSYRDADGRTRSLLIDAESWLLSRVEYLRHEDGWGDCLDSTEFSQHKVIGGMQIPHARHSVEHHEGTRAEIHATISSVSYGRQALRRDFYLPSNRIAGDKPERVAELWAAGLQMPMERATGKPEIHELGGGLWMLAFRKPASKVVIATFSDHSVVIEGPHGSATGEAILEAVAARTPEQPVRYLVMSDHHASSSFGLRPFVEAGVTLVTTPGNVEYLTRIANWSHAIEPDGQEVRRIRPEFLLVTGRHVFQDETQELVLNDIGRRHPHASEFLLSYFPAQQLLCAGDLLREPGLPNPHPANSHSRILLDAIRDLGLEVRSIVQSFPAEGRPLVAPFSALEKMALPSPPDSR